jgi:hypothetical protein
MEEMINIVTKIVIVEEMIGTGIDPITMIGMTVKEMTEVDAIVAMINEDFRCNKVYFLKQVRWDLPYVVWLEFFRGQHLGNLTFMFRSLRPIQFIRSYYNRVTLVGRLGKDPEFYEFKPEHQTGTATGKWQFSIVTKKSYKDPASNEWTESVTWHRISTTKDMKAIGQGSMVLVEGEIKGYKDSNDVQKTIIQASKVVSLQGKSPESNEPPME